MYSAEESFLFLFYNNASYKESKLPLPGTDCMTITN